MVGEEGGTVYCFPRLGERSGKARVGPFGEGVGEVEESGGAPFDSCPCAVAVVVMDLISLGSSVGNEFLRPLGLVHFFLESHILVIGNLRQA